MANVVTAVGQVKVIALGGLINDITVTVPDFHFQDFILNPFDLSSTTTRRSLQNERRLRI